MRITREALLRIAQDTINQRTRTDRSIIAVFLSGSLLGNDFLLGGTADVDLFFIHTEPSEVEREIVPLTEEIHLDIAHHFYRDYRQTRQLRVDAWMGPTLKSGKSLYDPQHFLDFTQASVRGQFERPDHVVERARSQLAQAREIWGIFHLNPRAKEPPEVRKYLRAVVCAANAIACLSGTLLVERRLLERYPRCAETVNRPGLFAGLLGLLGVPHLKSENLAVWLELWQQAYTSVPSGSGVMTLHPARRLYYQRAMATQLASAQPVTCLWPLLRTWTLAAQSLATETAERSAWSEALASLGLIGESFTARVDALDAYLDLVEEVLEEWARKTGAQE
jgi:hypothetical protein